MNKAATEGFSLEEEIIRVTAENIERLPMLEPIFERHVQNLAAAMKGFSGVPAEAELVGLDYAGVGAALAGIGPHWLAIVCEAQPWDGSFAVAIDPNLLFSLLEILLGGRAADPGEWVPRSFTSIEKRLATQICGLVLSELSTAFAPVEKASFHVSHFESSPQATMIAPAKSPCVKVTLNVTLEGRGGELAIVLPHNTLHPVRDKLSELVMGESIGTEDGWQDRMEQALSDTSVRLTAILQTLRVPLSDALAWRKGQVLDLGIGPDDEVAVAASGRTLLRGAMGRRRSGAAALRVTEILFDRNGVIR
ncbi:flagellar motor switch protein FliM [Roseivivax isoporae]|uniref:Flagellar motor switch protein FliM n=1 Tax=Roseivivax isoporae LMG 25204 TaxID=1449351 RepID=X7F9Y7_9RHOB|nr:FliM/FliN family flagellar motor switch protein [Roseivivax isoporae]ETX28909.1 hypothetical protein RISW2_04140 [Roseivivax isoporae LMG 25204]